MERCFLVLDTESTMCMRRRRRLLVALAYEVVWPSSHDDAAASSHGPMRYDIVSLPPDTNADHRSETIHGISVSRSRAVGRPLRTVLSKLFACIRTHEPVAIVGHDVLGDVRLLISEAHLAGWASHKLPDALTRLICTRMVATPRCALPMPSHVLRRLAAHGKTSAASGFKWPSLSETYRLLVQTDGNVAVDPPPTGVHHPLHDPRGDVERCREVFLCLIKTRRMLFTRCHSQPALHTIPPPSPTSL